jgi:hypothetical protein
MKFLFSKNSQTNFFLSLELAHPPPRTHPPPAMHIKSRHLHFSLLVFLVSVWRVAALGAGVGGGTNSNGSQGGPILGITVGVYGINIIV